MKIITYHTGNLSVDRLHSPELHQLATEYLLRSNGLSNIPASYTQYIRANSCLEKFRGTGEFQLSQKKVDTDTYVYMAKRIAPQTKATEKRFEALCQLLNK